MGDTRDVFALWVSFQVSEMSCEALPRWVKWCATRSATTSENRTIAGEMSENVPSVPYFVLSPTQNLHCQ
jgi:hypothetical protein